MRYFSSEAPGRTIFLSFDRGDLLLEGIEEVVRQEGIDFGVVTAGIGTLDQCHIHLVTRTDLPPADKFIKFDGPIEVSSIQGTVINGTVHLHMTVYDYYSNQVYVGHLEPENRVLYRMEICLQANPALHLMRVRDAQTGLTEILEREGN